MGAYDDHDFDENFDMWMSAAIETDGLCPCKRFTDEDIAKS